MKKIIRKNEVVRITRPYCYGYWRGSANYLSGKIRTKFGIAEGWLYLFQNQPTLKIRFVHKGLQYELIKFGKFTKLGANRIANRFVREIVKGKIK